MDYKKLTVSTGEDIHIFDNVFTSSNKEKFYIFMKNSFFKLGSSSASSIEDAGFTFFQSMYHQEDENMLGFFDSEEFKPISEKFSLFDGTLVPRNSWVNVSTHLSPYDWHVDGQNEGSKTMLYFANLNWNKKWGGETLFANNKGEVEAATQFIPGRVIIFDSRLEHKPSPVTLESGSHYRFVYVKQFHKN